MLNTYLVYLRFELMRGNLTQQAHEQQCQRVRDLLAAENRPHLREFLAAWNK